MRHGEYRIQKHIFHEVAHVPIGERERSERGRGVREGRERNKRGEE